MIRFMRSHPLPIGIDIGADSIKMLQLEVSGDGLAVVAAAREAMPDEARHAPELRMPAAVGMIRRMLHQQPFRGRRVVACLPREIVHVKNLRLPQMPIHELDQAIQFEARNVFDFNTADAHVRHLVAGEIRQGADVRQEVILMAARAVDVDGYLEQLHSAGCIVESLDVEPCALHRTVERFIRRRDDEMEVTVLVDVGARRSHVIVSRGRDISFYKPVDIGSDQMVRAVSEKLGITIPEARTLKRRFAEAGEKGEARDSVGQAVHDAMRALLEELGREIALCLRYYSVTFRGQRPTKVRLLGGEACNPQLRSTLAAALTIPVEAGRPLYSVDASRLPAVERAGHTSEWGMAFGLALRTTTGPFGARDGKARERELPQCTTGAQVVDLNEALHGPQREAVHA